MGTGVGETSTVSTEKGGETGPWIPESLGRTGRGREKVFAIRRRTNAECTGKTEKEYEEPSRVRESGGEMGGTTGKGKEGEGNHPGEKNGCRGSETREGRKGEKVENLSSREGTRGRGWKSGREGG